MLQLISKRFKFALRKTSFKKEVIGGFITFFAMLYILPVNSSILNNNGQGIPYGGVFVATALIGAIGSIIVGMFSNIPLGIAPGMGSNIFFVSTMIIQFNMSWEVALSIVILHGIIFTILSILGVVDKFLEAIPPSIKHALVFGLGLYLAYIGLKSSGIVNIENNQISMGDIRKTAILMSIIGIILVFSLSIRGNKMAILISLFILAGIGMIIGQINSTKGFSSFTDIKFDYSRLSKFKNVFGKGVTHIPDAVKNVKTYAALLAMTFMTIGGASGSIVSAAELAKIKDSKNNIPGSKKAMIGVGISSTLAGILGTSTTGPFLESNAGISAGAKTGFSSIIIGVLFLISIPLFPILQPLFAHSFVTSPILILVGSMMAKSFLKIEWSNPIIAGSSFIMIIVMIFTSSILNGIAFGISTYTIFALISGKWKSIHINMYIFSILFTAYIIATPFMV